MKTTLIFSILLASLFVQAQEVLNANEAKTSLDTKNVTEVKPVETDSTLRSPFGISFYTLGGYNDTQLYNSDPSYSVYDAYVSFSWKLPNDIRLSALPTFGYTTAGNDLSGKEAADKFYWRDFSLAISQNHLFENYLPARFELKQKARLYFPTSDGSKDEGMIARLRLELESKYNIDRFSSFRMYMKPSYYFQRTTAFLTSAGKTSTSKMADSQHGAEVDWNLNKLFSLKPGFEIEDKWTNKSEVNAYTSRHTSEISYRMGFEVRPSRDVNFTVGIQDKRDLIDPSGVDPTVSYSLLTNVTIL